MIAGFYCCGVGFVSTDALGNTQASRESEELRSGDRVLSQQKRRRRRVHLCTEHRLNESLLKHWEMNNSFAAHALHYHCLVGGVDGICTTPASPPEPLRFPTLLRSWCCRYSSQIAILLDVDQMVPVFCFLCDQLRPHSVPHPSAVRKTSYTRVKSTLLAFASIPWPVYHLVAFVEWWQVDRWYSIWCNASDLHD